jgi:hypothetical protein
MDMILEITLNVMLWLFYLDVKATIPKVAIKKFYKAAIENITAQRRNSIKTIEDNANKL